MIDIVLFWTVGFIALWYLPGVIAAYISLAGPIGYHLCHRNQRKLTRGSHVAIWLAGLSGWIGIAACVVFVALLLIIPPILDGLAAIRDQIDERLKKKE